MQQAPKTKSRPAVWIIGFILGMLLSWLIEVYQVNVQKEPISNETLMGFLFNWVLYGFVFSGIGLLLFHDTRKTGLRIVLGIGLFVGVLAFFAIILAPRTSETNNSSVIGERAAPLPILSAAPAFTPTRSIAIVAPSATSGQTVQRTEAAVITCGDLLSLKGKYSGDYVCVYDKIRLVVTEYEIVSYTVGGGDKERTVEKSVPRAQEYVLAGSVDVNSPIYLRPRLSTRHNGFMVGECKSVWGTLQQNGSTWFIMYDRVADCGQSVDAISPTLAPLQEQGIGCPAGCASPHPGCAIKGNISVETGEKIYHLPGQKWYDQTRISPEYGEAWFCTEAEARANGFRRSYE